MAGGFESLGLMAELLRAIDDHGWFRPTDVQDEAIPLILGGGDVMAAAETGSGKTAAFCLPVIQCVHERLRASPKESAKTKHVTSPGYAVKMNQNDKESLLSIENDGSRCSNSSDRWAGGRATHGVKSGLYYYEATIKTQGENGVARFGWSTMAAHFELGKDAHGFGYGGTGMKSYNGNFESYGGKFVANDVIGCCIDNTNFEISYSVNGTKKGTAFTIPEPLRNAPFFPALTLKDSVVELNFGLQPFKFPPAIGVSSIAAGAPADVVSFFDKEAFIASSTRKPLAIIIEPARDLAEQVYQCITALTRYTTAPEIKTLLIVGGDDNKKITKALNSGIDIVVGTLGKVGDMVRNKSLDLSQVRFFILDEADRLSDAENKSLILQLYQQCPVGGTGDNRLQVCFFSATLHSPEIADLSNKICVNPTWVDLKGFESVPETVHHTVFIVDPEDPQHIALAEGVEVGAVTDGVHIDTNNASLPSTAGAEDIRERRSQLVKTLKQHALLRIIDKYRMSQCMIFCRTNVDCDNLESFLCARGGGRKFAGKMESGKEHAYSCCVLGGMRSMDERRRNLEAFKEGSVRFLICTDVAARGIDVKGLPFVINMTLPDDANTENYIHRIGRVGRAERLGLAISIVAAQGVEEKVWYHICPNRGKGCSNRELKQNGGCTIWQNEYAALEAVHKRLRMDRIPTLKLEDDFSLPAEILALGGGEYGEERATAENVPRNLHIEMLAPTVQELATLEFESQNIFLQFSSGAISGRV